MANTIEPAASGRAKCRGCGEKIAKEELRLGARLPNPFDEESELTLWFHLTCGAFKRPEPFLEAAAAFEGTIERREWLEAQAQLGITHRRLTRLTGVSRAPTGRAKCRSCKTPIEKGAWRIGIVYYDEEQGRFEPAGFLHPRCGGNYFETTDLLERVKHFAPSLSEDELAEVMKQAQSPETGAAAGSSEDQASPSDRAEE